MEYLIKDMERGQIPGVVAVHLESFQGFFLSFLGPAFLRELYAALWEDSSGICLVALDGDQVAGFAAGTTRASGVYSRLLRGRFFRLVLATLPAVIKRPAILPRLLRGMTDPQGQPAAGPNRGRLMSIAVDPAQQGRGIGQALVRAFLERASARGVRQIDLTTDRDDNEGTNQFYRKLGFIMERSFTTPEGREMNQYLIDLD